MKLFCTHCKKDITKFIRPKFDQFAIGKYECPHCKKKQERYISEFDLMLYFLFTSVVYTICLSFILLIFQFLLSSQPIYISITLIVIIFIFGYFLSNWLAHIIYDKALYKAYWKNFIIKEDQKEVFKRMRYQFIILMLVIIVVGTQIEMFYLFVMMYIAIFGVTVIKTYLCYKYERIYYLEQTEIKNK